MQYSCKPVHLQTNSTWVPFNLLISRKYLVYTPIALFRSGKWVRCYPDWHNPPLVYSFISISLFNFLKFFAILCSVVSNFLKIGNFDICKNADVCFNRWFSLYFTYFQNFIIKVPTKYEKWDISLGYFAFNQMICLFILMTKTYYIIKINTHFIVNKPQNL